MYLLIPTGLAPLEGHPGWRGQSGQGFFPPAGQREFLLGLRL